MAYDPQKKYDTEIDLLNDIAFKIPPYGVECNIPRTTIKSFARNLQLFKGVAFPGVTSSLDNLIKPGEPEIIYPLRVGMYFNYFANAYLFLYRLFSKNKVSLKNFRNGEIFENKIAVESKNIAIVIGSLTTELCVELDKYCMGMINQHWVRSKAEAKAQGQALPIAWKTVSECMDLPPEMVGEGASLDRLFDITNKKDNRINKFLRDRSLFFCENIMTMIYRVNHNLNDIVNTFFYNGKESCSSGNIFIKSANVSGNDSHRHGRHVVIFELCCDKASAKIVYKPSDIEIDCIIFGDSQILNNIKNNFFLDKSKNGRSLWSVVEFVNKHIDSRGRKNAPIPTYKILPYNYGSKSFFSSTQFDFNSSYGFIEFISHYDNNNLIDELYIHDYWYVFGKIIALAIIVGTSDLHYENFICGAWKNSLGGRPFAPYVIDLEASFNRRVTIDSTMMFNTVFGIYNMKSIQKNVFTKDGNDCFFFDSYTTEALPLAKSNHLLNNNGELSRCWKYKEDIVQGVRDVSMLMKSEGCENDLKDIVDRLEGIVVRFIPISTKTLQSLHSDAFYIYSDKTLIYTNKNVTPSMEVALATAIEELIQKLYGKYKTNNQYFLTKKVRNIVIIAASAVIDDQIIDLILKRSHISEKKEAIEIEITKHIAIKMKIVEHIIDEIAVGDIPVFYMKWAQGEWVFLSSEGVEICKFMPNSEYTVNLNKELFERVYDFKTESGVPFFEDILNQLDSFKLL